MVSVVAGPGYGRSGEVSFMSTLSPITFADVTFDICTDSTNPALFVFGIRKSGSSIMNAMVAALAEMNAVNYVDVAGKLFAKGVRVRDWQPDTGMGTLLYPGNLYGGFRNAPLGIAGHPILPESPKVLLVRDPRDALVSEYFSNAYSHSLPKEGEMLDVMLAERSAALRNSISEYVMRMAGNFRNTLRQYDPFLNMPNMRLYRYEDAIMNKRWFLEDMCGHFGWTVTETQLDQILSWADVLPAEENPTEFVRKVTPGDHKDKLDSETIAKLSDMFAAEIDHYRYER